MKAVILDGARTDEDPLPTIQKAVLDQLAGRGWTCETFTLREMGIKSCVGCFGCWIKTPGECIINDAGRDVARAMIQSDVVIYLTPVTFGGYSSELKKVLDRSICLNLPFFKRVDGEIHHKPRYDRYPSLLAIGTLPEPDEQSARVFTTLVGRNAVNTHAPAHASAVIMDGASDKTIEGQVMALLDQVEVN